MNSTWKLFEIDTLVRCKKDTFLNQALHIHGISSSESMDEW